MSRTGRTIGAAVGAVLFVLFFAELATRFVYVAAAEPTHTVSAR